MVKWERAGFIETVWAAMFEVMFLILVSVKERSLGCW